MKKWFAGEKCIIKSEIIINSATLAYLPHMAFVLFYAHRSGIK
jgi:hypothetical protein